MLVSLRPSPVPLLLLALPCLNVPLALFLVPLCIPSLHVALSHLRRSLLLAPSLVAPALHFLNSHLRPPTCLGCLSLFGPRKSTAVRSFHSADLVFPPGSHSAVPSPSPASAPRVTRATNLFSTAPTRAFNSSRDLTLNVRYLAGSWAVFRGQCQVEPLLDPRIPIDTTPNLSTSVHTIVLTITPSVPARFP